jgi:hypothetical protein
MARQYTMTWEPRYTRWRKMKDGKVHVVSCEQLGLPPHQWTKEGSYQSANKWWKDKTTDKVAVALDSLPTDGQLEEKIDLAHEATKAKGMRQLAEYLRQHRPDVAQALETDIVQATATVADRLGGATPQDFQLATQTDRFLSLQRARPTKADTYGELRETVLALIGKPLPVKDSRDIKRGNLCGALLGVK